VIVLPMLAARRDPTWIPRYEAWWDAARADLPATPSPYALTLNAAVRLWVARARGTPPPTDLDLPRDPPPYVMAHFLAAREIIAGALITVGDFGAAAAMAGERPEEDWSSLMRASQALIGSWIAAAQDDAGAGRAAALAAAEHARAADAPWWLARALREAGEEDEARRLERGLGIPST
jgi:hypothetical protein